MSKTRQYDVQVCYEVQDAVDYVVEAKNKKEAKRKAEKIFIKECSGDEQVTEVIVDERLI